MACGNVFMKKNHCRVCEHECEQIFASTVLNRQVFYEECANCGYVQTEYPHWLEEAYTDVINVSDTGIMARNLSNANVVVTTALLLGIVDKRVVDAAGGMGLLVRLLRDYGVDALWHDPFCDNAVARGFEYNREPAQLVTAGEALEHFVHPADELEKLLEIAPNVLLSTVLIPSPTPPHSSWWYYGEEHGQHVGFFREQTLQYLATQQKKYLVTDGASYHLFSDKPINKIVWLRMLRLKRIVAKFCRLKMHSKTWPDHLAMIANK
jgi:hypothetical protein